MSLTNSKSQPANAVLDQAQWQQLNKLTQSLSANQLTWVSGYMAGLAQQVGGAPLALAAPQERAHEARQLTILVGSQTGNAKGVAEALFAQLQQRGIAARLVNMADYKPRQLKTESHIAIVVSTHGEGEAPDDAVELHQFLGGKKAPRLENLQYSVFALGDSSYEFFCQTGKEFDERLKALGAKAMLPRVDCDVDYQQDSESWQKALSEALSNAFEAPAGASVVAMPARQAQVPPSPYSKQNPFVATLGSSVKITGRDSTKDIRHLEILLADSGIQYRPGDALGVWFENDPRMVDELLATLNLDGASEIVFRGEQLSVRAALISRLELTQSYPTFISAYQKATQHPALAELLADKARLRDYLASRQILDIVNAHPGKITAQALVDALRPLSPRLYSIASSQSEVEDEVHLTVAMVEQQRYGRLQQGGASTFLGMRLEEGAEVRVYVEQNNNFRLPDNPDTPVIMVGPGTGIAPFRAFMQEREATGAKGKNWLFFGNPHFTQDFLYQVEWQRFVKQGVLDKVTLAFSRDQAEKIYVQHRIQEQGEALYQWLEQGAHFYICGDATHMAKDVHKALVAVVQQFGNKTESEAEAYLTQLRRDKRYQKDVY